jgi:hypothetical protein
MTATKNRSIVSVLAAGSLVALTTLCSCDRKPAEPTAFACEDIGWTFEYPSSWDVMSDAAIAGLEGRARKPIEEAAGGELEENHKSVLYLRKDQFNTFTSTLQAHDEAIDGPYEIAQKEIFNVVLDAYENAGIEFERSFGETVIDGLNFQTVEIKLFRPGTTDVLMTQIIHDRLFSNGNTLMVSINFNNQKDSQALQALIDSSRFTVRDR